MLSLELRLVFNGPWRRRKRILGGSSLHSNSIFIYILIVQILLSPQLTRGDPGSAWFQVCDSKDKHELNAVDCGLGLWLGEPMKMGCVCVSGVWILTGGFCDDQPIILVGDGDCFAVRKKIHSIKLLGNPHDPFAPATYIAPPDLSTFTKIPEYGFSTPFDHPSSILISINPRTGLIRSDGEVCVRVPPSKQAKPVHIWKNSRRQSNSFQKVDEDQCDNYGDKFDTHLNFGEIYEGGVIKSLELSTQFCSSECLTQPDKNPFSQWTGPIGVPQFFGRSLMTQSSSSSSSSSSTSTKIIWKELFNINRKLRFIGGSGLSAQEIENRKNIYEERLKISEARIGFKRETREQTVRMIQADLSFSLLNQPSIKVPTFEYAYFRKAHQMFLTVMPRDLIPTQFLNGIMRMWRLLLWESHKKFEHRETIPEPQHKQIMSLLDVCLDNLTQIVFMDWKNTSTHYCLNESITTFWNASYQPPVGLPMGFMSETVIPPDLVFDENKYDFVVEMAWKIAIHAAKRCSPWFRQYTSEYSIFVHKLDSLFNPAIVKRWYNPEESLAVLKTMYPSVNFRSVAYSTDRIAEAGRDFATYTGWDTYGEHTEITYGWHTWLRRPKNHMSQKKLILQSVRQTNRLNARRLRTKRDVRNSKSWRRRQLWGGRAHCIDRFLDPINIFDYQPPPDCFVPRNSVN